MDELLQDHENGVAETPAETPTEAPTEAATVASEPVTAVDSGAQTWPPPSYTQAAPPQMQAFPPPPQQGQPWYSQPGNYGAPQPGFPMPPGPPVVPPVQNGGEGRHSRGLMAGGIGALVLLILGAGIAIVVAMSGSHPVVVGKPAAQTLSTSTSVAPAAVPQVTQTVTKTAAAPPAPAPTPAASVPSATVSNATEIETMLNAHFQDLVNGNYAASFADLTGTAAGSAGSESEWISGQRTDGLYSFSLTVAPQVTSATTATAQITHFVTRASGSGCKAWTGSWSLVKAHGQWLISDANLNGSLSSCNA